jgi:hypothetical protein
MDRPIDAATAQQTGVCRIDDGVHFELGDVCLYNPDLAHR